MCRLSRSTARGILVPQPGIEPACPALQGRFFTAGPAGKFCCAPILWLSPHPRMWVYHGVWVLKVKCQNFFFLSLCCMVMDHTHTLWSSFSTTGSFSTCLWCLQQVGARRPVRKAPQMEPIFGIKQQWLNLGPPPAPECTHTDSTPAHPWA